MTNEWISDKRKFYEALAKKLDQFGLNCLFFEMPFGYDQGTIRKSDNDYIKFIIKTKHDIQATFFRDKEKVSADSLFANSEPLDEVIIEYCLEKFEGN